MKNAILGFLLATASMLYELILAQILSISLGGTVFQYTITIGIYATSLGIGSLLYQKSNETIFSNKVNSLYLVEVVLASLGALSLFGTYILQYLFFTNELPIIVFQLIIYCLIFAIGFLSGLELPLLMDINNSDTNSFSSLILFVDYLGTLMGCLLFPLLFLPYFNLTQTLFITALINLVVALFFANNLPKKIIVILLILSATGGLIYGKELSSWLSLNFIS